MKFLLIELYMIGLKMIVTDPICLQELVFQQNSYLVHLQRMQIQTKIILKLIYITFKFKSYLYITYLNFWKELKIAKIYFQLKKIQTFQSL